MPKIPIHKLPGNWKEQARNEIKVLDPPGTQRHRTDWMLARLDNTLVEESFGMLYGRIRDQAFRVGAKALLNSYDASLQPKDVPDLSRGKSWERLKQQASHARDLAAFLQSPFLEVVLYPGEEHVWGESRDLAEAGLRAGKTLPAGIKALSDPEFIALIRFVGAALGQIHKDWTGPEVEGVHEAGRLLKPAQVGGGKTKQPDFQDLLLIGRLETIFRANISPRDPLAPVIALFRNTTFPDKAPLTPKQVTDRIKKLTALRKKSGPEPERITFDLPSLLGCTHHPAEDLCSPDPGAGDGMWRCSACGNLGTMKERSEGRKTFHPLEPSSSRFPVRVIPAEETDRSAKPKTREESRRRQRRSLR